MISIKYIVIRIYYLVKAEKNVLDFGFIGKQKQSLSYRLKLSNFMQEYLFIF